MAKRGRRPVDISDGLRMCAVCKKRKPLDEFVKDARKNGGVRPNCLECYRIKCAQWAKPVKTNRKAPQYDSRLYRKRRDMGLCGRCASPLNQEQKRLPCVPCWFRKMALKHMGNSGNWIILKDIMESQHWQCAYSGERLIPGINASVDHKIPKSKGGTNDANNLQWVTIKVNIAKMAMPHDEFISLCISVAQFCAK